MWLKKYAELPCKMQNEVVLAYYNRLSGKRIELAVKRIFDITGAAVLILMTAPLMLGIATAIWLTSPGGVIFKQERIMRYYKPFQIYKFRTMYEGSEQMSQITLREDKRVTPIGKALRKTRLDELPQLFNVLKGEISLIGPRPEVPTYVAHYDEAMLATLLLPVGITSDASLEFREEALLLSGDDSDKIYIDHILPEKMRRNIEYLNRFSFGTDLLVILRTLAYPFL